MEAKRGGDQPFLPQQCLYFFLLPQGQGSLRPTLGPLRTGLGFGQWRSVASVTMSLAFLLLSGAGAGGAAALPPKASAAWMGGGGRQVAHEAVEGHHAGGAAEDVVADFGLDVGHQFVEDLEGLRLVFDERIALAVGAQADAVAQGVHAVEVLLPEGVHGLENDVALDRP